MIEWICKTCGTQYPESQNPPEHCAICEDERQYIGWSGQNWTHMQELQTNHQNEIRQLEPGLIGIGTQPEFAIGQRALLVQTIEGNLLWDCITLLDEDTRRAVCQLGGIRAIAISHPHYYSAMTAWAREFDAPVYLHSADRQWVMYPDAHLRFWQGENMPLFGGLTLVRCGGHFSGGTVAHWAAGAENRGVLLSGDIITVVSDRRWVSFMYSYPNLIPLPAAAVRHIVNAVEPYPYERIYGAWWGRVVENEAYQVVRRSARRYIAALNGDIKSTLPLSSQFTSSSTGMSLENAHFEEYHLSVEELALSFSLINRSDIAGAMMKETFDLLTDDGLRERLAAASHSLLARQLAALNGQNIPLLDERLQGSLLPFMQHRAIGELAISTGEEPHITRMYLEGSCSFSAHRVDQGVIHHIFHGEQAHLIRWLVTQLPTLPTGASSAASLGKIRIDKLGILMEVEPAQTEQFLKEAGVSDLTARALAQDIDGAQRVSLVFTRVTERKQEQPAGGMLLLLGKQHNWLFPCAEFKEESLADIYQGGMEKMIALLQDLMP